MKKWKVKYSLCQGKEQIRSYTDKGFYSFCICKLAKGPLAAMQWWAPDSFQDVLHFLAVQVDYFFLIICFVEKSKHICSLFPMKGVSSTVAHLQKAFLSSSKSQTGTPDSAKVPYYPKLVCDRHIWKETIERWI